MPDSRATSTPPPDDSHVEDDSPPWEDSPSSSLPDQPGPVATVSDARPPREDRKPAKPAALPPPDETELARFKELDQLVYRHSIGYLMVADALKEIGARQLYRANYKSFDDYCQSRHGFGKQQGNNLVEAANLLERIKPHLEEKSVVAPVTEGVIKELRRIKDDAQCAQAYVEAVQLAGGDEKVTAKDVRAAVKAVIAPRTEEPSTPKPAKKDLVRESLAQLREALKAGKPADELEPLLDALVQSLGL